MSDPLFTPVQWRHLSGRIGAEIAGADGADRLVFAHGFTQTRNSWKPIAEAFVQRGHQCIVVDLPGHGESVTVRADLRRTADMIATLGAKATYVGYSLGGRAMLHVAIMYPHLVQKLVLIGANPGIDDEDDRMRRRESDDALMEHMEAIGLEAFLLEWVAQPIFGGLAPAPDDMADRMRNTVEGLASSLRMAGNGAQGTLWPRLRELNMPVLTIAGENDPKFVAIARQIASAVPRSRNVTIPDAAHAAHAAQPQAVIDAIDTWINS